MLAVTAVGAVVVGGWFEFNLWSEWQNVERVEFNPTAARERLATPASAPVSPDDSRRDSHGHFRSARSATRKES